jgi:SOS-response transcriptional repressor LexA
MMGFLIPGTMYGNVKVLGSVATCWPSPAEEELIDTMTLDEFLIENRDAIYMLQVHGSFHERRRASLNRM